MNISGIIVEYNPFHNGHLYHLNKTKELTNPDLIIAITSGNFTQRGEISIINKFDKTKAALEHGVDLVVEALFIFLIRNKIFILCHIIMFNLFKSERIRTNHRTLNVIFDT